MIVFGRWMLYLHTIRHLRPRQAFWRVWRALPVHPGPSGAPAPALRRCDQLLAAFPRRRASLTGPDAFQFLSREGRVRNAADWNDPQADALWLYNLHYFDDLCAEDAEARRAWQEALIARWIAENPVGQGVGWDPYPLSLRAVNWIKWAIGRTTPAPAAPPLLGEEGSGVTDLDCGAVTPAFRGSLAMQARWLAARVEWHLLGNHVLANAKALVFAGCYFEGAEADAWREKGLAILREQLAEQVLADGGHFERSPMYHAIVLEDLLDLVNLARCYPGALPDADVRVLGETAGRMLRWARTMLHPDGGIAFFNDAAFGIAPEVAELERYAERLGIGPETGDPGREGARLGMAPEVADPERRAGRLTVASSRDAGAALVHLAQTGYVRLAQGPFTVLFDAAPVGPDYLPGHAHADTLSFELSHGAQRVICNSGTSRYGTGAERLWERSTAAHNTVEIDRENSSEVWSGFRVARRAYPVGLSVFEGGTSPGTDHPGASGATPPALRARGEQAGGKLGVACAHDGYARLRGRPMHRRTIEVSDRAVQWTDEVTGARVHRLVGRIPLHPMVRAVRVGESEWKLALPSGEYLILAAAGVRLDEEKGRYSPEFGLTQERQVLVWAVEGPLPVSVSLTLAAC